MHFLTHKCSTSILDFAFNCHLDEPDDLASLADDLKVLEALEQEGEVERDDRQEVDHVHWGLGNHLFFGAIGNCIAFLFLQTRQLALVP